MPRCGSKRARAFSSRRSAPGADELPTVPSQDGEAIGSGGAGQPVSCKERYHISLPASKLILPLSPTEYLSLSSSKAPQQSPKPKKYGHELERLLVIALHRPPKSNTSTPQLDPPDLTGLATTDDTHNLNDMSWNLTKSGCSFLLLLEFH